MALSAAGTGGTSLLSMAHWLMSYIAFAIFEDAAPFRFVWILLLAHPLGVLLGGLMSKALFPGEGKKLDDFDDTDGTGDA